MKKRIEAIKRFRGAVRNNPDATADEKMAADLCDHVVWSTECYLRTDKKHMIDVIDRAEHGINKCIQDLV